MIDYICGKFGDCSFIQFGFIVRTTDTHTHTYIHIDTAKRLTPATVVGESNEMK